MLLLSFSLQISLLTQLSYAWNVKSYPIKPSLIYPNVVDPDSVLLDSEKNWISNLQSEIIDDSKCECFEETLCRNDTAEGYTVGLALSRRIDPIVKGIKRQDLIMEQFAKGVRQRWNLGHCDDDVLIVIGMEWNAVHLEHGDFIETKIPKHLKNIMQIQATELLDPYNLTNVLNFLLYNYYNMLTKANNITSPEEYYQVYHSKRELSYGVFTVMVLVGVLSAIWIICICFMVVEAMMNFRKQLKKRLNDYKNHDTAFDCQTSPQLQQKPQINYLYQNEYEPFNLCSDSPLDNNCMPFYSQASDAFQMNNYGCGSKFDGLCMVNSIADELKIKNNLNSTYQKAKNSSAVARNKSLPPNAFRWLATALLKGITEAEEDSRQILIERF